MAIRIRSKVVGEQVFVLSDDIIKALYADLTGDSSDEQKKYIRAQIESWEAYATDIQKQVSQKWGKSWF